MIRKVSFAILALALLAGAGFTAYRTWWVIQIRDHITSIRSYPEHHVPAQIEELRKIGPKAVPYIVEAIQAAQESPGSPGPWYDDLVVLLQDLSGQSFGDDVARWKAWLGSEEGKARIPPVWKP